MKTLSVMNLNKRKGLIYILTWRLVNRWKLGLTYQNCVKLPQLVVASWMFTAQLTRVLECTLQSYNFNSLHKVPISRSRDTREKDWCMHDWLFVIVRAIWKVNLCVTQFYSLASTVFINWSYSGDNLLMLNNHIMR